MTLLPETLEVWQAHLARLAAGLRFSEEDDRVLFRSQVAGATRNAATSLIVALARHFGGRAPGNASRVAANRALAAAWMRRAENASARSNPEPPARIKIKGRDIYLDGMKVGHVETWAPPYSEALKGAQRIGRVWIRGTKVYDVRGAWRKDVLRWIREGSWVPPE